MSLVDKINDLPEVDNSKNYNAYYISYSSLESRISTDSGEASLTHTNVENGALYMKPELVYTLKEELSKINFLKDPRERETCIYNVFDYCDYLIKGGATMIGIFTCVERDTKKIYKPLQIHRVAGDFYRLSEGIKNTLDGKFIQDQYIYNPGPEDIHNLFRGCYHKAQGVPNDNDIVAVECDLDNNTSTICVDFRIVNKLRDQLRFIGSDSGNFWKNIADTYYNNESRFISFDRSEKDVVIKNVNRVVEDTLDNMIENGTSMDITAYKGDISEDYLMSWLNKKGYIDNHRLKQVRVVEKPKPTMTYYHCDFSAPVRKKKSFWSRLFGSK